VEAESRKVTVKLREAANEDYVTQEQWDDFGGHHQSRRGATGWTEDRSENGGD
jgi:hypothetical protein